MMCSSVRLRPRVKAPDDPTWRSYAAQAGIYDDLYSGRNKDYAAESKRLAELIHAHVPRASSVLDVGCGTGSHLVHLRTTFRDVEGVEPAAEMRAIAATRLPGVTVHDGDMRTLTTGRRYDAVICMFSAIGYVGGATGAVAGLRASIERMAAHLEPGGVLIVEPWVAPDRFVVGHVGSDYTHVGDRSIFRMSHSSVDGRVSVLTFHYLVGSPAGIDHFAGVDLLTMFTDAEYVEAFTAAGLRGKHVRAGFVRGLYVGS
jgi:dTDP-3-amino-3,4,6-trideoxy-alpha-D-glucopyranose N,N-dimethyltransferase